MIKKVVLIVMLLVFICPVQAKASDTDDTAYKVNEYREQIDRSLKGSYDDDTERTLDDYGISADAPSAAADIRISDILSGIWDSFVSALTEPMKILGKLIAICAFTVMVKSVADDSSLADTYDTAAVLIGIMILYDSTSSALQSVKGSLDDISVFMTTYIPVFSSVLASNSCISSAAGYYSVMFVLCEIITFIASNILLPFSGMVFAVSIVSSVNGDMQLEGITSFVKNAVKWVLTALMTVFTAVISLKGIAGAACDSVATKTLRFAASSFIPIVGGSVSEAYSTIYGSLGIIRSGVGVLGIAVVAVIALKPVITIAALKLVIALAGAVNGLFGQKRISSLLGGLGSVLSISLGIMAVMSMIFIISTAVVMLTSMNTV
ncbi:MAG: stage III sporulation protein AE [Ruminococcus sp.]|nr:stage III sporulation protein AE [Ruminococcus sp.]